MPLSSGRARAITTLHALLDTAADLEGFLEATTHVAAAQIPGAEQVTLVLIRTGHPDLVVGSDPVAARVERVDRTHDEGLASQALGQYHRVVGSVADTSSGSRSEHPHPVPEQRSAVALPRQVGDGVQIALTLYASGTHAWDVDAIILAEEFADEAADAVRLYLSAEPQDPRAAALVTSVAARAVVERAVGVIIGTNLCSADEARAILRRSSEGRGMDIVDAAAALVRGAGGPAPTAPAPFAPRDDGPSPAARTSSGRRTGDPRPSGASA